MAAPDVFGAGMTLIVRFSPLLFSKMLLGGTRLALDDDTERGSNSPKLKGISVVEEFRFKVTFGKDAGPNWDSAAPISALPSRPSPRWSVTMVEPEE